MVEVALVEVALVRERLAMVEEAAVMTRPSLAVSGVKYKPLSVQLEAPSAVLPTQVPLTAKQPAARLKPLAAVLVAPVRKS